MRYNFSILTALLLFLFLSCDNVPVAPDITVPAPLFSPAGGNYSGDTLISLSCEREGSEISWKRETSSSWMKYEGPFLLTESAVIEARAIYKGVHVSETVQSAYWIDIQEKVETPLFTPPPLPFFGSQTLSISCGTGGAALQYRFNGSETWLDYSGPLTISATTSIEARALKEGMVDSEITEPALYRLDDYLTVATYNVENFDLGGEQAPQYGNIAAFVKNEGVEVLLVNEMQTNDGDIAGFTEALKALDYAMPYFGSTLMSDGYNAIAAWSRYPLSGQSEVLGTDGPRTILRFKVTAGNRDIWFYGCHLKSGPDLSSFNRRVDQSAALEQYVKVNHDPVNDLIVLLGDMNTMGYEDGDNVNEDFAPAGTLEKLELKSDGTGANDFIPVNHKQIFSSYTYPGYNEIYKSLLDHIILSPTLYENHYRSGSVRVPRPAGDGTYGPSDHYPVVLELGF